jgi:glycosidase
MSEQAAKRMRDTAWERSTGGIRAGCGRRSAARKESSRAPGQNQWPRAATLCGGAVLAAAFAAGAMAPPAAALTPSPEDWRDLVIYQIFTDRFMNGDPSNDAIEGSFDPSSGTAIHGGDFAGIEQRLDYIQHLGAEAIWISPVVLNANAEYHGYAARDFFTIAPHLGGLPALRSMIDAAHARGIYVILDVVTNHMGDLIHSTQSPYPQFKYPGTYPLSWRNAGKRHIGFFDDLTRFHAHGGIQSFVQPDEELGELFGLDDLKTEDPEVVAQLVAAATFLIDSTDCDGFRIDTVKHIEMPFWQQWTPAVRAHAVAAGKDDFFMFGEVFDGSDAKNGAYTGTVGGGPFKLDATLYFPMYFTTNYVFREAEDAGPPAAPAAISDRYASLGEYDVTARERLVTFLDNHDLARFMGFQSPADKDESRARAALGFHLTTRGVPIVYYGTEQSFDGGGDPFNREDMWDGQWDFGPSEGDNFDLASPLLRYIRSLIDARKRHEALHSGAFAEIYAEAAGPGLYVFSRQTAGDTVLVAVNNSNLPQTLVVGGPWPAGTPFGNALDPGFAETATPLVTLNVPARGVRVLETLASRAGAAPPALRVVSLYPGHDQRVNDRWSPLSVVFDRDVDPGSVAGAFSIAPPVAGAWQVAGRVARFFPAAPWPPATAFAWSLDSTLAAADGGRPAARIDAIFSTSGLATGITVEPGFTVDLIARQRLESPEGLLSAPWVHPHALLVSDSGLERVLTLTPGGATGHFLGDQRWTRSECLAKVDGKPLRVVDELGVFDVDGTRMTTQKLGSSTASETGAGVWGGSAFFDQFYMCDPASDRIVRISPISTLQTFASGILGGEGLAFGPGGAWGTDLYVADANLTSIGSPADGDGRIVRLNPNAGASNLVVNTLLDGASGMAFDTTGRFGGDLFVADILGERILRVTPGGQVSVFASGFNNLSGSHCLTFGGDGALYVADPGGGVGFSNSNGDQPPSIWRIAPAVLTLDAPRAPVATLALGPPAPNPSDGPTAIRFTLPAAADVTLEIVDVSGRRVRTLACGERAAGTHALQWDGRNEAGANVAAGIYFVTLEADGARETRRFARIR